MTDTSIDNPTPTPRHDGWTPDRQCVFLDALAAGGLVRDAALAAGMSHEAAYQLRQRNGGAAFRLGWNAALLMARVRLCDTLMERAVDGQEDVIVREVEGETRTRTRHRHDNRLALSLLARLDRFADDGHAAHTDARAVEGAWEAFLDLVRSGGDAAALSEFLAVHRPPEEAQNTDIRPCQLCGAEPVDQDGEGDEEEDEDEHAWLRRQYRIWWNEDVNAFRTNFPPPPGFTGYMKGDPDSGFRYNSPFERALTRQEAARETEYNVNEAEQRRTAAHSWRREYFQFDDDAADEDASCDGDGDDDAVPGDDDLSEEDAFEAAENAR